MYLHKAHDRCVKLWTKYCLENIHHLRNLCYSDYVYTFLVYKGIEWISHWMSILFPKLCYEGAQLFLYYSSLTSKHDFTYVIMFCKAVYQFHLFFEKATRACVHTHTHTHKNELAYTQCVGKHSLWHPLVCTAYTVSIFLPIMLGSVTVDIAACLHIFWFLWSVHLYHSQCFS